MKKIVAGILCIWVVCSCKQIDKSIVTIEGKGFDKNVKKVYLTEAHKWEIFLDSANCIDGKFTLCYKQSPPFEPFFASVCYLDSNNKKRSFSILNGSNGFMLDYGMTTLSYFGPYEYGILLNIKGGPEQDLLEKYDRLNFGYVPKARGDKRVKRLKNLMELVKDNPYSFYMLFRITQYRERYSKEELKEILSYFDEDVQKSRSANFLTEYIENTLDKGENTRSLSLISDKGVRKYNINKTSDLNMLIFWASWCGPCRLEIPQLRKLNQMVKSKDFYMASISIDKDKNEWDKALGQEKLTWAQFRTEESEKDKIKAQYRFTAIPLVVFTNKDGKELGRLLGYDLDHMNAYKKIISDNLHIKLD